MTICSNYYLTFLFSCIAITIGFAQVNIKVGYNLGYTNTQELDELVTNFNTTNDYRISKALGTVNYTSGIDVGFRYSFSSSSVELAFDNLSTEKEALGEEPSDASLFKEVYFFNQKGLNFSLETRSNKLGWGIGLMRRTYSFKTNIATSNEKRDVLSQSTWALKAHTSIILGGTSNISFAIKPFYIFPLSRIDLTPLAFEWNIVPQNTPNERFGTFGLSFVFYNGPQG